MALIFLWLTSAHNPAVAQGAASIGFTIESDKMTYATSEKIILHLEIKNISAKDVEVVNFSQVQSWLLSAKIITFDIQDADGETYGLEGSVVDYWPGDRVKKLSPEETMTTDLIINDWNARNFYRLSKQSEYEIVAIYHGLAGRTVESNPIIIKLE